ncbi:hypothetical protein [Chryseobacterium sp. Leaf394]|uniref:hypothetical protein n=1 Tax=Chryseobacterium sp. Leaf394 TaxID=1736361 RepID=UPI0006F86D40|nr:hypothetical protein [Chryseobacterium sp. Leaf394]KQS94309.1 hypothetical protein ASG21_18960 [Chryseobacterium sp. Leaf394]
MEIEYLKLMKKNPEIDDRINEGIIEKQIAEMELFAKHKFPDAYREFLFLGGENDNVTIFRFF